MAIRRAATRIALNVALDGLLAAASVPLARWMADPAGDVAGPAWTIAWGAAALLLCGVPFRLSVQYWRFSGTDDLLGVAAASVAAVAVYGIGLHEMGALLPSPSFPAIHLACLVVLLALPRVGYRVAQETPAAGAAASAPVLLLGAGEGADLFIRALAADRAAPYRVAGLLSMGHAQTGRRIAGNPILGHVDDLDAVLERLASQSALPSALVVTAHDLSGAALARVIERAEKFGLRVARAPRLTALDSAAGRSATALRPVAIEELLNRPQVPLDRAGMARLIQGRRVLVTGAGGTIGAELARQVAALGPDLLVLLDNGEYALWQIDLELAESHPTIARRALIADVRDAARLRSVCTDIRPELVFHAAALKHVPIGEANPLEDLLTNAAGTRHVADAARAAGAAMMVLISTDKAVNPTSVMGASKRIAEMYCQALDVAARTSPAGAPPPMRCVTVRFGNVLGSTGSVVPLFQRQLARGGPLTVTHPDMQRYFMTVREAVGLVLQASVVGSAHANTEGGSAHANTSLGSAQIESSMDAVEKVAAPTGGIFVLDMGEPVRIVDLARQMIRLAGLRPDADIGIAFTGLRPGEKLFEELFHGSEPPLPTGTPGLLMATPRTADPAIVGRAIDEIAQACRGGQTRLALTLLGRLIPEFEHNAQGDTGRPARAVEDRR